MSFNDKNVWTGRTPAPTTDLKPSWGPGPGSQTRPWRCEVDTFYESPIRIPNPIQALGSRYLFRVPDPDPRPDPGAKSRYLFGVPDPDPKPDPSARQSIPFKSPGPGSQDPISALRVDTFLESRIRILDPIPALGVDTFFGSRAWTRRTPAPTPDLKPSWGPGPGSQTRPWRCEVDTFSESPIRIPNPILALGSRYLFRIPDPDPRIRSWRKESIPFWSPGPGSDPGAKSRYLFGIADPDPKPDPSARESIPFKSPGPGSPDPISALRVYTFLESRIQILDPIPALGVDSLFESRVRILNPVLALGVDTFLESRIRIFDPVPALGIDTFLESRIRIPNPALALGVDTFSESPIRIPNPILALGSRYLFGVADPDPRTRSWRKQSIPFSSPGSGPETQVRY
ncbi:hypothetical protein R1sor_024187 [Riccia sorocarpa]|uniref:Uncharacterized protein n=1 Tax=Riccia sorocarpa TaxID=122646 RepID=A0ABD3GRA9_9MARC